MRVGDSAVQPVLKKIPHKFVPFYGRANTAYRAADAQVLTVDDAQTVAALRLLWSRTKQLIEPSSATVLAAVLAHRELFAGRNVGVVLSGGNVDFDALPALLAAG